MDEAPEIRQLRTLMERLSADVARNRAIVEEWSKRRFTASTEKGGVTATVDAVGSLTELSITPLCIRRLDRRTLAEAIVAAVHAAEAAAAAAREEMMDSLRVLDRPSLARMTADFRRDLAKRTGFPV